MATKTHKATSIVTDLSTEEITAAPAPKNGRAHLVVKNDDAVVSAKADQTDEEKIAADAAAAAEAEKASKDAEAAAQSAKDAADAEQAAKTAAEQGAKIVIENAPTPISPGAKAGLVAALGAVAERVAAAIARISALPEDPAATYIPYDVWDPILFAEQMLEAISNGCTLGSPEWEVAIAAAGAKAAGAEQGVKARLAAKTANQAALSAKNDVEAELATVKATAELSAKSLADATAALDAEKVAHAATAEIARKSAELASKASRTVTPSQTQISDRAPEREPPAEMPMDLSLLRRRAVPSTSTRR